MLSRGRHMNGLSVITGGTSEIGTLDSDTRT